MIRNLLTGFLIATFISLSTNLAHAGKFDESDLWKVECIGRYMLNLPGVIEVATQKPSSDAFTDRASFSDQVEAPYSNMKYFGYLDVISPANEADFINLKKVLARNRNKFKKELLDSRSEKDKKLGELMKPSTEFSSNQFGWYGEDYMPGLYYLIDNKIYAHSLTNYDDPEHRALNKKHFNDFMNGFHPRALYETPNQPGVCLPYGFIADDGTATRNIAVTMRLIGHPDVEIFFQDSSYQLSPGEHSDSKQEILLFLEQYARKQKFVDTGFWGTHSIQMSGQKGSGNFFTIARKDETIDYGYIASVKGDFSATTDTPAQMLYVIRTASRAKGKPVSKDELKDMAEKIVASIKRHPIQ